MTEKRMFEGAKEVFRGTADNHLIGCGKEILLAIVFLAFHFLDRYDLEHGKNKQNFPCFVS